VNQKKKIQNALKLCDKMAQLESLLWQRYYKQFLDLLADEDLYKPSEHIKDTNKPS
jgi:hypothetical protein